MVSRRHAHQSLLAVNAKAKRSLRLSAHVIQGLGTAQTLPVPRKAAVLLGYV